MEFVEGTDLHRYLRSRGVLDVERAVIIAHDTALGLGNAHRNRIVYRKVKPHNKLVACGETNKLIDFCIASVYGTKQYYSPEQAQGEIVGPTSNVLPSLCMCSRSDTTATSDISDTNDTNDTNFIGNIPGFQVM